MALPTTERLVWHGSDNTVKPESVSRGRFFITKIIRFCCTCFLWHLVRFSSHHLDLVPEACLWPKRVAPIEPW